MKLGKLEDIKVPLQVVLGETEVSIKSLSGITEGTIIELKSLAGEPVDLIAAGEKIGEGEVVIIEENFGLRVTNLVKQEER